VSIPVSLERVRDELGPYGPPFLLTVNADGRPHAVAVEAGWDGDVLVARAGRRTAANAADRPAVALLWPPFEAGGYSVILDGQAEVVAIGDDASVRVVPTKAVLHRAASTPAEPGQACSSDCVPLT
jgi:hypothetical protein